ncbi:hypothetical protein HYALB_00006722 [Hymenoscyphus albidus]|uniref:protein-ribulosamine 3-kinase n=1 Tax=Hymenoscyphus albidus TaxID=595503 RepID=A0A9N9LQ68_9HELO|nr:hypothetical protein HYALB_00006722 [Hymenoscyphus albidus]
MPKVPTSPSPKNSPVYTQPPPQHHQATAPPNSASPPQHAAATPNKTTPSKPPDPDLRTLVQKTATTVVPRLLRNGHLKSAKDGGDIFPVVVHGDLWSGNRGRGCINGGAFEEVVFDPSCCWGHSEFEFGIMRMFGGFGGVFEREYFEERERLGMGGRDEPVGEWGDRVWLYELYVYPLFLIFLLFFFFV